MTKKNPTAQHTLFHDTLLSCLGSLLSILLVRWVSGPAVGFSRYVLLYLAGAVLFSLLGFYLSGFVRNISRDVSYWMGGRLVASVIVKEIGLSILMLTDFGRNQIDSYFLLGLLADILFTLGLIIYPRSIATRIRREALELRSLSDRLNALVYGDDDTAADYADKAALSGRYSILGLLTHDPEMSGKQIRDYIVYYAAGNRDLDALQWRLGGIDCILFPENSRSEIDGDRADAGGGDAVTEITDPMKATGRFFKRGIDLVGSFLLLLIFSPLMALCAVVVLLEDGKPVIYRQERIGRGGKAFDIYKFRTMRLDAETMGPALYSGDDDPRLTRAGRFLRRHHLDELPQLWNVFRGDMSFIGYRPERKFYIDQIMARNPRYRFLFQIRPGVTSYATLYNGYTDTLEKMLTRLDMDLYYLRNHSVWFDFRILGLTFLRIVGGIKF